jgi:hypothetical protein
MTTCDDGRLVGDERATQPAVATSAHGVGAVGGPLRNKARIEFTLPY